eukprot:gene50263-61497_t
MAEVIHFQEQRGDFGDHLELLNVEPMASVDRRALDAAGKFASGSYLRRTHGGLVIEVATQTLTSVELLRFADVTIEVNGVPAAPLITGYSSDTGVPGDALTADRSISLTGTAASFAQVEIFADGASLGSVTAASNGAWSFITVSLADGEYDFAAQATKGGLTSAASATLTLTIDATPPTAPTLGLLASSDSGVR